MRFPGRITTKVDGNKFDDTKDLFVDNISFVFILLLLIWDVGGEKKRNFKMVFHEGGTEE